MRATLKPHHPRALRAAGAVALALLMLPAGAGAQIYKWIDAAGNLHYSQTPPPSQRYTEMAVTPPSSSAGDEAGQLQELIDRQQDADVREAEDRHQAAERAKQMAERAALCVKARDDLARLTTGSGQRHLMKEGDGTIHRLSAEEHAQLIERVRKDIADNCSE